MKKYIAGFTLVELSIVLVIIGLLIGGLLVAQSMIGTTKVQAFTRQIQQFDAATSNFLNLYKRLPGDSNIMYAATPGDRDGLIGGSNATSTITDTEVIGFWPTLSLMGFKGEENPTTGYTTTLSYNGQFPYGAPNAPKSKLGVDAGVIAIGHDSSIFSTAGFIGDVNMYIITNCSAMSSTTPNCINGMSDADAIAADTKMDNGVATTGNILGVSGSAAYTDLYYLHVGTPAAAYIPSSTLNSTTGTILLLRMGAQTGNQY